MPNKRVVVTGGSGRIGQATVRLLHHTCDVVIFDQIRPALASDLSQVHVIVGDHTNLGQLCEAFHEADAVIHLSAIPGLGPQTEYEVFRTNILGTFAVHQAAALSHVPVVISASSQSAFGWAWGTRQFLPRYLPLDEAHPDEPDEGYGLSKVAGEQIAWAFARKTGMRTVALRPPMVTSKGTYGRVLASNAARQWRATLFSYLDVEDLARAFQAALEAEDVSMEAFNVAADDSLCREPLSDLLPRLDERFRELAQLLTGTQPMVSNAKAKRMLKWSPRVSWRHEVGEVSAAQ